MESEPQPSSSKPRLPFGSWPSLITAELVASSAPKRFDTHINEGRIFWCESIASEKGRTGIMMFDGAVAGKPSAGKPVVSEQQPQSILPRPLSVKSKVHEYGGAAFTIDNETVYFVLADDQRIYSGNFNSDEFVPTPLTPDTQNEVIEFRFADLIFDATHKRLIAVCEAHNKNDPHNVQNYLVSIPVNPENQEKPVEKSIFSILHQGHDFYSNPRISPNGKQLVWLTWDHPDMPWDNTQLWLADISQSGLDNVRKVAGNGDESIFQPSWSETGDLFFVSDRNNWWNIYRLNADSLSEYRTTPEPENLCNLEGEFATPQWVFGMSTYGFLNQNTLLATYTQKGEWHLAKIHLNAPIDKRIEPIDSDLTSFEGIQCAHNTATLIAASPTQARAVYQFSENTLRPISSITPAIGTEELSTPTPIEFPTTDEQKAKALFYPPQNSHAQNTGESPPLIVICHGGPTGATESSLNFKIQYWTNRGFAVADVNYRGSTGYGREFRQRLFNKWGVYDVDDVCAVVDYLGEQGLVDPQLSVIKGSSAGGYTVLAALTFKNTFKAGVSLYGIGDLELLANDTHKFEARYLDKLIGPYPEKADVYKARSPIHFVEKISCPMLIFQGLQDKVVPPNQAERIVAAAKSKGLPVAYVTYPEEAHGFRQPKTIEHMLNAEHQFYAYLLGLEVEPTHEPLDIQNR